MSVRIGQSLLQEIASHGEATYPDEGAGFLLGEVRRGERVIVRIRVGENTWEGEERSRRYLLGPLDMQRAEKEADSLGLQLLGVFHSHPDHPAQPSDFDRLWALPWFSYLITSIQEGQAADYRCWRLDEDRQSFQEEELIIHEE